MQEVSKIVSFRVCVVGKMGNMLFETNLDAYNEAMQII